MLLTNRLSSRGVRKAADAHDPGFWIAEVREVAIRSVLNGGTGANRVVYRCATLGASKRIESNA